MKQIILLVILFVIDTLGQNGPLLTDAELFVGTENVPPNTTLTFVMEAISTVWSRTSANDKFII